METTNNLQTIETVETVTAIYTEINSLPDISVTAGNDPLRPAYSYINFNWDGDKLQAVCTNAHFLVYFNLFDYINSKEVHKFKTLFPEGFYIHSNDWKLLTDKKLFSMTIEADKITLNIEKRPSVLIPIHSIEKVGKYVNWKAVIPTIFQPVQNLTFNAEFLAYFQKIAKNKMIRFYFNEVSKATKFQIVDPDTLNTIDGLIMSIVVSNY